MANKRVVKFHPKIDKKKAEKMINSFSAPLKKAAKTAANDSFKNLIESLKKIKKKGYEKENAKKKKDIKVIESIKFWDESYSEIEHAIMDWSNDGTKTAGHLTRKIILALMKRHKKYSTFEGEIIITKKC